MPELQQKAAPEALPKVETVSEAKPLTNRVREQHRYNLALAVSVAALIAVVILGIAVL